MRTHTFTIFNSDNTVYGYLFDVTRVEANAIVQEINDSNGSCYTGNRCYYMEGYHE